MARYGPTLVLLPLLVACATTSPSPTPPQADGPVYLQGISSQFSTRLDELNARGAQLRATSLPNAVIAGDSTLTVTASLFQSADNFTLDMVIQNHNAQPFVVDRGEIRLYDRWGRKLTPVSDWPGAERYGLRAEARRVRDYVNHLGNDPFDNLEALTPASAAAAPSKLHRATGNRQDNRTVSASDFVLWQSLSDQDVLVVLPDQLLVGGRESRPYWAYWQAGPDVTYPVTAVLVMNHRKMFFQFTHPRQP